MLENLDEFTSIGGSGAVCYIALDAIRAFYAVSLPRLAKGLRSFARTRIFLVEKLDPVELRANGVNASVAGIAPVLRWPELPSAAHAAARVRGS